MTRDELLTAVALQIADYRQGEIPTPTPEHVDRWVHQFDDGVQLPILDALHHVLDKIYMTRDNVKDFLHQAAVYEGLTGGDPSSFWRGAGLLDIQQEGASQSEMVKLFGEFISKTLNFGIESCTGDSKTYVYLDDGIFSGTRLRYDLEKWLETAPTESTVHVVVMALHTNGEWYAKKEIEKKAEKIGKRVDLKFMRGFYLENKKSLANQSDVLWPTHLPEDPGVRAYANSLESKYRLVYRVGTELGRSQLYQTHAARLVLEQEFLKAGVKIRSMCPQLKITHRPLGYSKLDTLGFGTMFLTYRNCPNNAPLALWVGDPWYPLFPRKTNAQTARDE